MSSQSGLTRRRGAGGGSAGQTNDDDTPRPTPASNSRTDERSGPETAYENGENGHKIAFDPKDMNESAERNKQPKLTLMEEILLMGLKDKEVRYQRTSDLTNVADICRRAICLFGTTIYHMRFEDV